MDNVHIDYRDIKIITNKYTFRIPRVDDLMHSLSGAIYFRSMYLKSGYHQIEFVKGMNGKLLLRTRRGSFNGW